VVCWSVLHVHYDVDKKRQQGKLSSNTIKSFSIVLNCVFNQLVNPLYIIIIIR